MRLCGMRTDTWEGATDSEGMGLERRRNPGTIQPARPLTFWQQAPSLHTVGKLWRSGGIALIQPG